MLPNFPRAFLAILLSNSDTQAWIKLPELVQGNFWRFDLQNFVMNRGESLPRYYPIVPVAMRFVSFMIKRGAMLPNFQNKRLAIPFLEMSLSSEGEMLTKLAGFFFCAMWLHNDNHQRLLFCSANYSKRILDQSKYKVMSWKRGNAPRALPDWVCGHWVFQYHDEEGLPILSRRFFWPFQL